MEANTSVTDKQLIGYDDSVYQISVILPVFNQPLSLAPILGSLMVQDFAGSYEVIICDDGSSPQLFTGIYEQLSNSGVPVKYTWQQNRKARVAASRNNGIRLAKGELLLFLDGDMIPETNLLSQHLQVREDKTLIAGNRLWRLADTIVDITRGPIDPIFERLRQDIDPESKAAYYEKREQQYRKDRMNDGKSWRVCFTCNLSVPRSNDVCFDENFVGYGYQDLEMSYRLVKKHGYKAIYREEILAYHVEFPGCVVNALRVNTHEALLDQMRNAFYFYDLCPEQDLEDIFYNLPRFVLDQQSNTWHVAQTRPDPNTYHLPSIVKMARKWLIDNHVYPGQDD